MAEQRFTVGDQITVVITGEMTGITPDGTLTVQYPSSLGACETHVELEDTSVVVMHERDADKATPVLIEERDSARAEVERLRALRAKDLQWEARLAEGMLSGQDATNDLAEQIRRAWMVAAEMHEFNSPDGDHLEGCPGCRIEAALGGTEAGQ